SYKAFHSLTELEYIYMKSVVMNGFSNEFDHDSFENVRVVEFDSLNKGFDKDIPIGVFNKWKNLRMLTIVNSGMESVNWLAGEFFNLWHLDLSNNSISHIRDGLITSERFPKLRY